MAARNPEIAAVWKVIRRALSPHTPRRHAQERRAEIGSLPVLAVALLLAVGAAAQTRSAGEYEVKAAFLFNFAKFIEWPAGAFSGSDDPIRLCLLGGDPFAGTLEQVVQDKIIGGRKVEVAHLREPGQARGCHILFVSTPENKTDRSLLRAGYGPGVLTVGESSGFALAGGVIDFVEQENRVAFEINLDAADRAGVKISSKLLSLARIVHDDPSLGKP